jgi:hypothetical protein
MKSIEELLTAIQKGQIGAPSSVNDSQIIALLNECQSRGFINIINNRYVLSQTGKEYLENALKMNAVRSLSSNARSSSSNVQSDKPSSRKKVIIVAIILIVGILAAIFYLRN